MFDVSVVLYLVLLLLLFHIMITPLTLVTHVVIREYESAAECAGADSGDVTFSSFIPMDVCFPFFGNVMLTSCGGKDDWRGCSVYLLFCSVYLLLLFYFTNVLLLNKTKHEQIRT